MSQTFFINETAHQKIIKIIKVSMHIIQATKPWKHLEKHKHTHTHTQNHEKCLKGIIHKVSYKEQYKHIQKNHEKCLNIIMHKTIYRHLVALDKHKNCENCKSKN
jgi:hypothetical protein